MICLRFRLFHLTPRFELLRRKASAWLLSFLRLLDNHIRGTLLESTKIWPSNSGVSNVFSHFYQCQWKILNPKKSKKSNIIQKIQKFIGKSPTKRINDFQDPPKETPKKQLLVGFRHLTWTTKHHIFFDGQKLTEFNLTLQKDLPQLEVFCFGILVL